MLGGAVFYEIAEAAAILREYARYALTAPDELTTMAMLMAAPPAPFIPPAQQGKPVVSIFLCYTGDLEQGERVIAPLRKLGTVVADVIAPIPYPVMFAFTEEASRPGFAQYVRSLFAQTLSDKAIQVLVKEASQSISPETMVQISILDSAMSRVPTDETAFAHWDKQAMISVFDTEWQPGNRKHLARAEQLWHAISPYSEGCMYISSWMRGSNESTRPIHLRPTPVGGTQEQLRPNQSVSFEPEHHTNLVEKISGSEVGYQAA